MTPIPAAAKAWIALIGAVVTALLGTVPPDTTVWQVLTYASAVLTALVTFAVPNAPAKSPDAGIRG